MEATVTAMVTVLLPIPVPAMLDGLDPRVPQPSARRHVTMASVPPLTYARAMATGLEPPATNVRKDGSLWIVPHQLASKAVTMAPVPLPVVVTAIPIGLAHFAILALKDGLTLTAMKLFALMVAQMGLVSMLL